jgi:SAM-dependent methyltransferase
VRSHGSVEDFERDWREALATRDPRWFIYPSPMRPEQTAFFEWVKAGQVLAVLRSLGVVGGRALEYGCGAAGMSIFLKERGYDAVGVDLSVAALQVARQNDDLHRRRGAPLMLVAADSLRLPFADGQFDVVMSYGLLEHFESAPLGRLLDEVVRVLRPGGVFIADIVPAGWNARYLGTLLNFLGSATYNLARGRPAEVRALPQRYFGHYFETSLSPADWEARLVQAGLAGVEVRVCRPFPLLAVTGTAEDAYVRVLRALLPVWLRFDRSGMSWKRHWGWMYLAWGVRPPDACASRS